MRKVLLIIAICFVLGFAAYTQLTLFVVQPIGAVPNGVTLVVLRGQGTEFIDSADAMCLRLQGGVSILCRGMVLGTVSSKSTILMKLPYSEALYSISTDGQTFDR